MVSSVAIAPGVRNDEIFISYCRRDKEFVIKLCDAIRGKNRGVWVDWEDIPPSSDWRAEIRSGIEGADSVVFVLSPDWIASRECNIELEQAIECGKRLIPIVHRDVQYNQVHPALASINWIFFRETEDFDTALENLMGAIDTDLEYVRAHTRLLERAIEWDRHDRDASFMLRGTDLQKAEQWLLQSANLDPKPTPLHTHYILESSGHEAKRQQGEIKRQRIALVGVSLMLAVATALGLVAYEQHRQAERESLIARTRTSEALFTSGRPLEALIAALRAGREFRSSFWLQRDPEVQAEVTTALLRSTYWVREYNRLKGHTDIINSTAWSPSGQVIATASGDGSVKLWSAEGASLFTIQQGAGVLDVSFSPDGQVMATGDEKHKVILWSQDGILLKTLAGHTNAVQRVQFSPDGRILASGGEDGTLRLWSRDGVPIATFQGKGGTIWDFSFSPNGQTIATAHEDGTVKLWNLKGKVLRTIKTDGGPVLSVQFSPDGRVLATGQSDNTVRIWKPTGKPVRTLRKHNGRVPVVRFSADGQTLASGSDDHTIQLWRWQDGTPLNTLPGNHAVLSVGFHPTQPTILVSGDTSYNARLWQLNNPLTRTLDVSHGNALSIDFSPPVANRAAETALSTPTTTPIIVIGGGNGSVQFWQPDGTSISHVTGGHRKQVWEVSFSPDGETIATASYDRTIKLWTRTGKRLRILKGHQGPVYSVTFSADGKTILSASEDRTVRLWNLQGELQDVFAGHSSAVYSVSASPDQQTYVSGDQAGTIMLWNQSGILVPPFTAHENAINSLYFAPNGQFFASGGEDGLVKLWTPRGKLIKTLEGHKRAVTSVQFSPDNRFIASGSAEGEVILWNHDGTLIARLEGYRDGVSGVSFSPDGKFLTSVSFDGTMIVWNLEALQAQPIDQLMSSGCRWLQNYLRTDTALSEQDRKICPSMQ